MLLKTLKTGLFLCVMVSANAQNFVDATIFKLNGDSISGQINYQEWYINPAFITFRTAKSAKIQEFRPKDLSKFVIKSKNEIYESAVINVLDQTERDLEAIDASPSIKEALQSLKFRRDTAFLLVLEKGKGSLYSYVDNRSLEHYFIRKDKGRYIELMNPKMKITESKIGMEVSRISYLHIEDYKTRLKELTSDCSEFAKEIDNLGFFQGNFSSIISRYNNCVGKNDYSKNASKIKVKYFATIGISLPMAQVNGLFYNESSIFLGKLTTPIGGGFEVSLGQRGLNPLRLGAEMSLTSNKYQSEISGNNRTVSYNAKLIGVHLFPYLKANLFDKKQREQVLFFKIGAILTYYPTRSCEKKYVAPANFFADESFTLTSKAFSIVVSGGYQFKHLYIEGLFLPYSENLILNSDDTFRVIGGTLKLGYIF